MECQSNILKVGDATMKSYHLFSRFQQLYIKLAGDNFSFSFCKMKGVSKVIMKKVPTSNSKNKTQHHAKDNIIAQIRILKVFHAIQQLGKRKTVIIPS